MLNSIRELYRYRALIVVLVSRDLKARYRGSVLGFMWSMLNPFLMMLVYWLVFSIYLRNGMEHYHVYLFCGLLPWLWFSASLLEGCGSIISGANLVKKVMFPAEILPLVVVISNLIHFCFGLPILAGFLIIYRIIPGLNILVFPLIIVIQFVFTFGLVLALSALSVHLRDIQQILTNIVTLWFFMSPIVYNLSDLNLASKPAILSIIMNLNPMKHIMESYHRIFLQNMTDRGSEIFNLPIPWLGLGAVLGFSVILLMVSWRVFNRLKTGFSEEI
ncbi:ABC transporter permease [bacterium]|nr:ABC transporter permease [candidate division CSSED10-310 bacterium]